MLNKFLKPDTVTKRTLNEVMRREKQTTSLINYYKSRLTKGRAPKNFISTNSQKLAFEKDVLLKSEQYVNLINNFGRLSNLRHPAADPYVGMTIKMELIKCTEIDTLQMYIMFETMNIQI